MAHNSWLEQIYYFAEYYFYEPQHIFKIAKDGCTGKEYIDEARNKIRRNEVPLNICFNVLLRLLPEEKLASIIESATTTKPIELDRTCNFVSFWDAIGNVDDFIQPDAVIESSKKRIYIELKIGAEIKIKQIAKYMYFHELWNYRSQNQKEMIFLLISPKQAWQTFNPTERKAIFDSNNPSMQDLQNYIDNLDASQYATSKEVKSLNEAVRDLPCSMTLAHMTWNHFTEALDDINDNALSKLINDFTNDIKQRDL